MTPPPPALLAFVKFLEKDKELQSKIKIANSSQQIIDIAELEGFTISSLELRAWSKELTADYFPWATQGNEFRRNFFQREGSVAASQSETVSRRSRSNRRPKRRELFCPKHPEQQIQGNGKKYFLHLLTVEALRARGMPDKKAKLVINAYPVLVLTNEWLEELFCPECGTSTWCHVTKHDRLNHTIKWASRELWIQVAHVDPQVPNPSVSEFTRRASRQLMQKRVDGKRYWDR